ncbi:MAG: helix-hairpin-helix domain-containing protein [Deltaproteobacteria bacterium]|nr:helix-hairpin-helix domain-containing protein [Deltaproteobacteria bacterium]
MQSKSRLILHVLAIAALLALAGPPARGAEPHHAININSASADELASLPGIGESKAKAIIEYRAAEPFKTVDDLKKVKGIGDKTLESLRPDITVGTEAAAK